MVVECKVGDSAEAILQHSVQRWGPSLLEWGEYIKVPAEEVFLRSPLFNWSSGDRWDFVINRPGTWGSG